jgi:hypothetical protein
VTINNITVTVGGTPHAFPVLSATFSEALAAGKHYTLVVDLKKVTFAGSNIFWDATLNSGSGGLTFLDSGGNYGSQGHYLRWGSLPGISPSGGSTSSEAYNNVMVYTPKVDDGTWIAAVFKNSPVGVGYYTAAPIFTDLTENYLYDHPDFENYYGDICAYLTGKSGVPAGNWRMPNAAEFGVATDYSTSTWSSASVSGSAADQVAGKGTPGRGQSYYASSVASLFFPAGGYRPPNSSIQFNYYGYYWSGTPGNTGSTDYAYRMDVRSGGVGILEDGRLNQFAIRCVKI